MKRMLKFLAGGELFRTGALWLGLTVAMAAAASAQDLNAIKALEVESGPDSSAVTMTTETPVGYRYTVYDSFDPVRVVVDFPGMETSALEEVQRFEAGPIQEVRVSSFDLESGKLGRVEILLDQATNYEVDLEGNRFQVVFAAPEKSVSSLGAKLQKPAAGASDSAAKGDAVATEPEPVQNQDAAAEPSMVETEQPAAKPAMQDEAPAPEAPEAEEPAAVAAAETAAGGPAKLLYEPEIEPGSVVLNADGRIDRHQYFKLGAPPRLVVDVYGVKPNFSERTFTTSEGMRRMRVGTYADKTRLVFDAAAQALPHYNVSRDEAAVKVAWGEGVAPLTEPNPEPAPAPAVAAQKPVPPTRPMAETGPVSVEALDFATQNGESVFTVELSGPTELIPATQDGDMVRFGVRNALLSQKLRRTVDASAFPSAVRLITPYTVQNGAVQEVRFAVELKGPTSFELNRSGQRVKLVVDDGPFAEERLQATGVEEIPLPARATAGDGPAETVSTPATELDVVLAETAQIVAQDEAKESTMDQSFVNSSEGSYRISEEETIYTGDKISLTFFNADIHKIMRLIGGASDMNIIVSDDVKGTITLDLKSVPWDQALDLVMNMKDLGMIQSGNVIQVLPRNQIRAMEEEKLTAKRTREKLEDLEIEIITISYTDLDNVVGAAKDQLTERGSITKDDRNKQIIVKDIPSAISKVRNLVSILDTPERQVMIEARIVEADSSFGRDLGVNWGLTVRDEAADADVSQELRLGLGGGFLLQPPVAGGGGSSGLASAMTFGQLGTDTTLLDLRISALETSGHGKVVSTPRVTTLNGETAKISQGTQIPYVVQSDSGPNTEFVEAALSLEVTPVINPDGSIILEIKATNSTPGSTVTTGTGGSAPSINSKEAETKVLVKDGETTVLGGIYVEDEDNSTTGVPWLSKVPILGHLFKSSRTSSTRSELLVFITPRILQ